MRRQFPFVVAVVLIMAMYTIASLSLIRKTGLQYDEALFVNAATSGGYGSSSSQFVSLRIHGVAVALMPYIGALKAWVWTPIFSLFGVSLESIRAPAVLLGASAVSLVTAAIWRCTGRVYGLALALLLCTEPVFSLMTRLDWGPVVIAGFLRAVALYAVIRLATGGGRRWVAIVTSALVLGLFNKLDFGIFAVAFLLAFGGVFWPVWRSRWKSHRTTFVACGALMVTAYGIGGLAAMRASSVTSGGTQPLSQRIPTILNLISDTFSGVWVAPYITDGNITTPSHSIYAACLLGGLGLICVGVTGVGLAARPYYYRRSAAFTNRLTLALIATAMCMVIGMAATPQVNGPHHAIAIWPLPQVIAVLGIAIVAGSIETAWVRRILVVLAVTILSLSIANQMVTSLEIRQALSRPHSSSLIWTTEIQNLTDGVDQAVRMSDVHVVIVTDWGIGNQIAALATTPTIIGEAAPNHNLQNTLVVFDYWSLFYNQADPNMILQSAGIKFGERFLLASHSLGKPILVDELSVKALVGECVRRGGVVPTDLFSGKALQLRLVQC